jgi:hypothetical protein
MKPLVRKFRELPPELTLQFRVYGFQEFCARARFARVSLPVRGTEAE